MKKLYDSLNKGLSQCATPDEEKDLIERAAKLEAFYNHSMNEAEHFKDFANNTNVSDEAKLLHEIEEI